MNKKVEVKPEIVRPAASVLSLEQAREKLSELTKTQSEKLKKSEANLNNAFSMRIAPANDSIALAQNIALHLALFNYELNREVFLLLQYQPTGFASKVSLKGLVHRMFEFESTLSKSLVGDLKKIAEQFGDTEVSVRIKEARKRYKSELTFIQTLASIRNNSTGHYHQDVSKQRELLEFLDYPAVFEACTGLMGFIGTVQSELSSFIPKLLHTK
jgi:hypothetical protein